MNGRVALYLRVSTPEQNLDGQERDVRNYAARRGWEVSAAYREKVTATGKVARAEYDRLISDAAKPSRPWCRVLVWSLDRWSRSERFTEAVDSIWALEKLGVSFHSCIEPVLDTPSDGKPDLGRDVVRMLLPLIASFELRRLSERVKVAMRELKEGRRATRSGRPVGRPVRVTAEKLGQIRQLRSEGVSWAGVAVATSLRKETCRRAFYNLRSGRWSVQNTPTGERLVRHPSQPDRGQGNP